MNLKEPRKKKGSKLQQQLPFPISINSQEEWTVFTGHLSVSGVYIVDPAEMTAVHSMGFFGKGSLSRNFPSFGKRQFGAPPRIRARQYARRQQWLEEMNKLQSEAFPSNVDDRKSNSSDETMMDISQETNSTQNSGALLVNLSQESDPKRDTSVDEVILDSTEDEEVCEILHPDKQQNYSQSSEIYVVKDKTPSSRPESVKRLTPDPKHLNSQEVLVLSKDPDALEVSSDVNSHPHEVSILSESPNSDVTVEEIDPNEAMVLPDSDSDTEKYLINIKPRIETGGFPVSETLQLTFEEAFFLMYGLGCLQIIDFDGKQLSIIEAWNLFNEQDKYFITKYVVYHYFRSKGWVVKPGLKFGGDFLLYKEGPPFYHASYIVVVESVDPHSLTRHEGLVTRKMTWNGLMQSHRLAEVTAKEFLLAQVIWPTAIVPHMNHIPLEALSEFTVRELLWRRWKANQNDDNGSLDEDSEEEDSS